MGIIVSVRHQVLCRLQLVDGGADQNEGTVETSSIEGYELVIFPDDIPELLYDFLFVPRFIAHIVFFEREHRLSGRLEENRTFPLVRVQQAYRNYLRRQRIEREAVLYFLLLVFALGIAHEVFLGHRIERPEIPSYCFYIEYYPGHSTSYYIRAVSGVSREKKSLPDNSVCGCMI